MSDGSERGITRREFVQTSAVVAAAPLVTASFAGPIFGAPRPAPLKVGLVGCGGRGTGAATQALAADPDTVLHALADIFPEQIDRCLKNVSDSLWPDEDDDADDADGADDADTDTEEDAPERPIHDRCQVPEERRFVGFDAYRSLIGSGVDVVLLATPPGFRPWQLRAALEAGKHVFCEKPMATDGPGVRSVLESAQFAREKQLNLVSGFCWRYHSAKRATLAEIENGRIGDLRAVYTTYNTGPLHRHDRKEGWSDFEFQLRNWQHFDHLSGDHLVEQAVHSLDKMMWVLNGALPEKVTGVGGRIAREGESSGNIYDHFALTYEFPGGVKGFHMSRQIAQCSNDNSDHFIGSKGTAFMDWNRDEITGESPWKFEGKSNDMYQQEHDELFAAIRAGKALNDGEWMAHSTLCAIMGRMAAYTGKTVTWEQALESEERLMPAPEEWAWGPMPVNAVPVPGKTKLS